MTCGRENSRKVQKFIEHDVAVKEKDSKATTFSAKHFPQRYVIYTRITDFYYKINLEKNMFNTRIIQALNFAHVSIRKNELYIVKNFLDRSKKSDIISYNQQRFLDYTLLHFTTLYGHVDMTKFIIARGIDVKAISIDGTALQIAVDTGNSQMMDVFIETHGEYNAIRNIDRKSLLHSLLEKYMNNKKIRRGQSNGLNYRLQMCFVRVVKKDENIDHRDDEGNTVLHLACEKLSHGVPFVRMLLNYGANINVENNKGETALECAFHEDYQANGEAYMILYHHVKRLQCLGLAVSRKNDAYCLRILKESYQCEPNAECFRSAELNLMRDMRMTEIIALNQMKLKGGKSLCDFLKTDDKGAAEYVTDERLKELCENMEKLSDKYPIYEYLISLKYARGMRYRKLNGLE